MGLLAVTPTTRPVRSSGGADDRAGVARSLGRSGLLAVALVVLVSVAAGGVAAAGGGGGGTPSSDGPHAVAPPDGNATTAGNDSGVDDRSRPSPIRAVTADRVPDLGPSLVATDEGYLAVWRRQVPGKELTAGFDLFFATYEDGEWSTPRPITDDRKGEAELDVAYDPETDRGVVVWQKLTVELGPNETPKDAFRYVNDTQIFYATYDGDSWSEPVQVTDSDRIETAARVVESDGAFHLAWRSTNSTFGGPFRFKHARLTDEGLGRIHSRRFPSDVWAVAPGSNGRLRAVYLRPDESDSGSVFGPRNGTLVFLEGTDRLERTRTRPAQGLAELAFGRHVTVWSTVQGGEETVYYTADGDTERIQFDPPVSESRGFRLASAGGRSVLLYQARYAANVSRYVYRRYSDGRWTGDRPLNATARPNFTFRSPRVATNATGMGLVFLGTQSGKPDQNADLFGVVEPFRPDLRVRASTSAENVSVGDEVTVNFAVENAGTEEAGAVSVEVGSGSAPILSRSYDALPAGEAVEDSVTLSVPDTGQVVLRPDPDDAVAELTEGDGTAVVSLVDPDPAVVDVGATRNGSTVSVTATVENVGPVDAGPVEVAFRTREGVLASRTVETLPAGERRTVTVETTVRAVTNRSVSVALSAPRDADRGNDVGSVVPLGPEVGLVPDDTTFQQGERGIVARVSLVNRGFGNATVPVVVRNSEGERIGARNVTVGAATRPGDFVSRQVNVVLPASAAGTEVEVVADVDDSRGDDNVFVTSVPTEFGDRTPPTIERVVATATNGTLKVRIEADEFLAPDSVNVTVTGPESVTLTGGRFERSENGRRYVATVRLDRPGTYTVRLESATDRAGNSVRESPSTEVTVDSVPTPTATRTRAPDNGSTPGSGDGDGGGGGGGGGLIVPILVVLVVAFVVGGGVFVYKIR